MQRMTNTAPVDSHERLHSNCRDGYYASESAVVVDSNFISPVHFSSCLTSNSTDYEVVSEKDDDTLDDASCSTKVPLLVMEDPIVTYDSIVMEMAAKGVEWIPADQMNKEITEIRWAGPDVGQLSTDDGDNNVDTCRTYPIETPQTAQFGNHRPPLSAELSPSAAPAFIKQQFKPLWVDQSPFPPSHYSASGGSGNALQLKDIQLQLDQEKASRRQQEEYIQQLQLYYDNLLAKHAAAESTIDQLRFQAKVGSGGGDGKGTPKFSTTLRGRKLISASLDTCSQGEPLARNRQSRTAASLLTFQEDAQPQSRGSRNSSLSRLQPRIHLLPLSSSFGKLAANDVQPNHALPSSPSPPTPPSTRKDTSRAQTTVAAAAEDEQLTFFEEACVNDGLHAGVIHSASSQEVVKSLEMQINASLAAIYDRLNDIESYISKDEWRDSLSALTSDLEALRRRYEAEQVSWSNQGKFDDNAIIASRLDRLSERICRLIMENNKPSRPSSLVVKSNRPTSAAASTSSGSSVSTFEARREGSSSSAAASSMNLSTTPESSQYAAETHFTRLLTRYNSLKGTAGSAKDLESLMQRMLQLSDRYSSQSSVIFSPARLRRMFEADYVASRDRRVTGAHKSLPSESSIQICPQNSAPETLDEAHNKLAQVITPDSGVPQTPMGSSGGSLVEFRSSARRGSLTRQLATIDTDDPKSHRKQSDSGVWATDSSAVHPFNKSFSRTSMNELEEGLVARKTAIGVFDGVTSSAPGNRLVMHPSELMSLEADIQNLHRGIAKLTSASSMSTKPSMPRCWESHSKSTVSNGTFNRSHVRNDSRLPTASNNSQRLRDHSLKRDGHTISATTQPLFPTASSSSDEDVVYTHRNRPRPPSTGRFQASRNGPLSPLEVVGYGLTPQHRSTPTGPTRTYSRTSLKKPRPSHRNGGSGCSVLPVVGHRRSRSSTGQRTHFGSCGSCGGSGLNLNMVGGVEEDLGPAQFCTFSDPRTMPARVIYEYKQTPTVRLPVQEAYNCWSERVYGMKELYGTSVSPQTGRAYNTIGHQPTASTQCQQPILGFKPTVLLPAVSSPQIPQRNRRPFRQYVKPPPANLYFTPSSSSDSEEEDVVTPTGSRSFGRHLCHDITEPVGKLSSPSDAFAAARCVTEMAHRLNDRLNLHRDGSRQRPSPLPAHSSHRPRSSNNQSVTDNTF